MSTLSLPRAAATEIELAARLDGLRRDEIERLQARNLAALVRAAAATPAVRAYYADVEAITTAADLQRLPLLSPARLVANGPPHGDDLLLGGAAPGLALRSSGTAGRCKILYHSWSFNRQVGILGARGLRASLDEPPRRIANCVAAGSMHGAHGFVQSVGEHLPALTFGIGSDLGAIATARLIDEHAIDTLVAFPAFAVEVAAGAPWPPGLRNVLYIGEALHEVFAATLAGAAPSLRVRSLAYSTNETGPIGYQCPHLPADTHHVNEDAVVVEVVDARSGLPVADGTTGEVVVTPLTDSGMALFRYRVGDRGVLREERCPCGSAARLLTLIGRSEQSMVIDGLIVSDDLLMGCLATVGVHDRAGCQLQLRRDGAAFELTLLVAAGAGADLTREAVAAALRADYALGRILASRRSRGLQVQLVSRTDFARSPRGKTPMLLDCGERES